jgi:hypothetical protein
MNRLNVPVSMKCKTDKPERHKDGSGHHHPMGVFPIEEQLQEFGHCSLVILLPLRLQPSFARYPLGSQAFVVLLERRSGLAIRNRLPRRQRVKGGPSIGLVRDLLFR